MMINYPDIRQNKDTSVNNNAGKDVGENIFEVSNATDNIARILTITHGGIEKIEADEIINHWETVGRNEFTVVLQSTNDEYTCCYIGRPIDNYSIGYISVITSLMVV